MKIEKQYTEIINEVEYIADKEKYAKHTDIFLYI